MHSAIIITPIGKLAIAIQNDLLARIDYVSETESTFRNPSNTLNNVIEQLECYFQNSKHHFDLPLAPAPTPFQKKLRKALIAIPLGQTATYGQLAKQLKSGARAVGNGCRHNPISIIIPCHRVTAAQTLGGYTGQTDGKPLDTKKWLLQHEGINANDSTT